MNERLPITEKQTPQYRYSYLLFDFDGVITDHQLRLMRSLYRAFYTVLRHKPSKDFYQRVLMRKRNSVTIADVLYEEVDRVVGTTSPYTFVTKREVQKEFSNTMRITLTQTPGMVKVLRTVLQDGVRVCIVTNESHEERIKEALRSWSLDELSSYIFSPLQTGVKKPDPEAINLTLKAISGKEFDERNVKQQTLVIGDESRDIVAATHAGVDSVLMVRVSRPQILTLPDPAPTYVISDPFELLPIIYGAVSPERRSSIKLQPVYWKEKA